jgi:hypothetical protein
LVETQASKPGEGIITYGWKIELRGKKKMTEESEFGAGFVIYVGELR